MTKLRQTQIRLLLLALCGALLFAGSLSPTAGAGTLTPPRGKTFFGVTDTGNADDFRSFAQAVDRHPALVQTFHPWGNSFKKALPRWRSIRARPMLHITTRADSGAELITPRQIAQGYGDDYLIQLNRSLTRRHLRMYLRPLGEPNRCLNPYAGVDCSGRVRGGAYAFRWYRQAFRRIATIVRGGGRRKKVNRRLVELKLPRIRKVNGVKRLPTRLGRAPVAMVWSPLPAGSPTVKANFPAHYWPGGDWVDWVGTDFYNRHNSWKYLKRFYSRFAKRMKKPMALTEFGLWGRDGPNFMKRIFHFAKKRDRVRMMVYYQDFGSSNQFRIQNFPRGRKVLRNKINSPRYPRFASRHPR